jgi:hypothetical protein
MLSPDPRHPRRSQADFPLIGLSEFGQPPLFEVLYRSLGKDGWASTGPFGRTVLPLDQALRFIATEDIFWALV